MIRSQSSGANVKSVRSKRTVLHAADKSLGKKLRRAIRVVGKNVGARDAVTTKSMDGVEDGRFTDADTHISLDCGEKESKWHIRVKAIGVERPIPISVKEVRQWRDWY